MDIVLNLATFAGLTLALTEVVKRTFGVADRFVAGASVVIGIALALLFVGVTKQAALEGIIAALMASGLWSQGSTWAGQ